MAGSILQAALAFVLVAFLTCALASKVENFFLFHPESRFYETPSDRGLQHEETYFATEDDVKLHGWFFPIGADAPVILFCHGNAGNISHRLENVAHLLARGLKVFIFDYRGYGKSEGTPSEQGLYRDGRAAYDYLVSRNPTAPHTIIPFGRSLGAAVALEIALTRDVRSVILESPFTSTKEMARSMLLFRLFSFMVPPHYNNKEKISRVSVPILILHGDRDSIVPFSMGRELYTRARDPKYFYRIRGAGHNDTYLKGGSAYYESFVSFALQSRLQ